METILFILLSFTLGAFAIEESVIDYSKVINRQDVPGFWDSRIIKPIGEGFHHKFDRRQRIVGGNEVDPNAHPYQVGLFLALNWGQAFCGGCLVSKNLVLTAAHCLEGTVRTQVVLGAHTIFNPTEPTQVRITVESENYIEHPQYDPRMFYNDLALLVLPHSAPINKYINPIALPYPDMLKLDFAGEIATVSGWGRFSDSNSAISNVLQYTQNEIKENDACYDIFGHFVIKSTLCTITRNTQSGICNGDSGGPLTLERNGKIVLVGVVSYGALAGCELGYPAGFARVTYFMPWISKYIKMHG